MTNCSVWNRLGVMILAVLAANRLLAQESPAPTAEAPATEPAAAEAPAADGGNLFKELNEFGPWVLQLIGDGKGAMWAIDQTLLIITSATTGENWHVQCFYPDLDLKEGQEYVVKFKAKSPESAQVLLVAQLNEDPWNELGLHEELSLTPEYKDYEFTFTATGVGDKVNRIGFSAGVTKGVVYAKDLSLTAK